MKTRQFKHNFSKQGSYKKLNDFLKTNVKGNKYVKKKKNQEYQIYGKKYVTDKW